MASTSKDKAISHELNDRETAPSIPELDTEPLALDEAQIRRLLEQAEELKQEGNEHFRGKSWNEALATYRSALGRLPKRPISRTPQNEAQMMEDEEDKDPAEPVPGSSSTKNKHDQSESALLEPTPLQEECAKARSVLNANIAACHMKLSEHSEVVAACTEALCDDPMYVKALQRRATSNEELDTWTSLSAAQEDYNKLLTVLPSSSPQYVETRRLLNALKPRVEAAQKRETSEMMDKLKGIGNSILGNFGLSTNNFQFTPNGQGGYSMQFVQ